MSIAANAGISHSPGHTEQRRRPGIAGIAGPPGSAALVSASSTGAQNSERSPLHTHRRKVIG